MGPLAIFLIGPPDLDAALPFGYANFFSVDSRTPPRWSDSSFISVQTLSRDQLTILTLTQTVVLTLTLNINKILKENFKYGFISKINRSNIFGRMKKK
jgi:hypothetical protein